MSCIKNYLNDLLCACAPDCGFAQDAIEHAVLSGRVQLTCNPAADVFIIMGQYDQIIAHYHAVIHGGDRENLVAAELTSATPRTAVGPRAQQSPTLQKAA